MKHFYFCRPGWVNLLFLLFCSMFAAAMPFSPSNFALPGGTAPSIGITSFNSNFSGTAALAGPGTNTVTASNAGGSGWDFASTASGSTNVSISVAAGGADPGGATDYFIRLNSGSSTIAVGSAVVKSDDGSAFDLNYFYVRINMPPSSTTNVTVSGYRAGIAVSGATKTLSGITTNNSAWYEFDVSTITAFQNVDEFIVTQTGTSAIITYFGIDQIDIGPATTLPLTLTDFSGQRSGSNVMLGWTTASEENTSHFDIQRGTDGINYSSVGNEAAAGNSSGSRNYTYIDPMPANAAAQYFYRLQMIDLDGSYTYSPVLRITGPAPALSVTAYPNPFSQQTQLAINAPSAGTAQLTVTDLSGRTLFTLTQPLPKGNSLIPLPALAALPKGVYALKVVVEGTSRALLVVKSQ